MTTNDLALLTLTLKAIGYHGAHEAINGESFFLVGVEVAWNPLTNNGDALSVAVKLALMIDIKNNSTVVRSAFHDESSEVHGQDAMAATRRAIVRTAAALAVQNYVAQVELS